MRLFIDDVNILYIYIRIKIYILCYFMYVYVCMFDKKNKKIDKIRLDTRLRNTFDNQTYPLRAVSFQSDKINRNMFIKTIVT